ncbi:hypothetical protein [Isobaculum melis]|uniref:Uncharacterized protein n=1 Tax=Isobaculum melis TaxID=142588 RepID=A0A1H9PRZ9_9LACT|nr:hypothetical protein [Isobaculum melis]SER50353.1 hypothetical protein SAMN04488559_10167 [Isobaculum melis]
MKGLTVNFMEEVFHHLDSNHLGKLVKIVPQKISGLSVMPKNASQSFKNRLFKQFLKKKNLAYIFKYISNGNFHDILVKDGQVYENIIYGSKEDFFEAIQDVKLQSPFSFYIYLIEQNDESVITNFFNDIDGIHFFREKALLYVKENNKVKNSNNNLSSHEEETTYIEDLQKKMCEMDKVNNTLLQENRKLKKKIEKNNNEKNREIQNLEKKYLTKIELENKNYKNSLNNISTEIYAAEERYDRLKKEIYDLNEIVKVKNIKIDELQNKNDNIAKLIQTNMNNKSKENDKKINILLIGIPGKIVIRQDFNFEFINPTTPIDDIEDVITNKNIKELWITAFQVVPRKKKKIIQKFESIVKIQELNDFTKLMNGGR